MPATIFVVLQDDVQNLGTDTANVQVSKLEFSSEDAERGDYAHFMLKEIFEQPRTVENALRARVDHEGATAKFGGLNLTSAEARSIERIVIAASGTSWHAALVGEYLIEELAHLPVETDYGSEYRYRDPIVGDDTLVERYGSRIPVLLTTRGEELGWPFSLLDILRLV